jgi:hypothetical protein
VVNCLHPETGDVSQPICVLGVQYVRGAPYWGSVSAGCMSKHSLFNSIVGHTMDTVIFKFLDDREPVEHDVLDMPQFTLADIKLIDCSLNYSTGKF